MGWREVEGAFNDAVARGVFPGATVMVRQGAAVVFDRLRANLFRQPVMRWEQGWKAEAAGVFAPVHARG